MNSNEIFSKLKIIDLSTVLAGPSVATFFGELGANVIKIEHPIRPDVTRSWKLASEDSSQTVSAYFSAVNYKKDYLSLDLKNEKDYATFIDHVQHADILLSNFKKGDDEKLNVSDEQLRSINPSLIIGKITGFGNESDRVAYDLILQAETGFMSMNGTQESGPVKMPVALIDVLAAHHLKEGLLIALLQRNQSNEIKTVSVSLYDAAICSLANQASNYLMEQHIPQRIGSLHPNIAPYGEIFSTKSNDLVTFAIGSNQHFEKLCSFLRCEDLITDDRFKENKDRVKNRMQLFEYLQEKIKLFDTVTLLHEMHQRYVPAGEIKNLQAVFQEQAAQNLIRTETINGKETKRITSIGFQWK
jgi:crotonobetainyl-CoA:carnitine CoA-transferase CaiB-like acyl-CoA transferase